MNDDRLADLLRETDRALPPPTGRPDLAARVRRRAAQHRIVRRTGGALAAAIALALGATFAFRAASHKAAPPETPMRPDAVQVAIADSQEELAQLRAELDQLRAEADSTLAIIEAVKTQQQQRARAAAIAQASSDPQEQIRQELDRAAFTIVYQADRMYRELGLKQSAIRDYRQTIELFPGTPAAQVARERLTQIETNQGDQL